MSYDQLISDVKKRTQRSERRMDDVVGTEEHLMSNLEHMKTSLENDECGGVAQEMRSPRQAGPSR